MSLQQIDFSKVLNDDQVYNHMMSSYDKLMLRLVPDGTPMVGENLYDTLLNATCFVASLSDGKANELSKQIH